jgi:diguanylate cyclase (GGDEF)-like protein
MGRPHDGSQPKLLLVDDSKFVRTTFRNILGPSFAILEDVDGAAAWQTLIADSSISMVFTDLDMPRLDGYALIERIRAAGDARIAKLPVVVISGAEEQVSKKRALEVGANEFISKNADPAEIVTRIQNLMRLMRAEDTLDETRQSLERTVTHDPLTGALTSHYLQTEGAKRFAYARRHGGELSVMALRVVGHDEMAGQAGRHVADQILVRIARLMRSMSRAEDSIGRAADSTFVVVSAGTGAAQVLAFARRLCEQLQNAKITYGNQLLKIGASCGVASLGADPAGSIDELMKLALRRLEEGVKPEVAPQPAPQAAALPAEIEKAVAALEKLDPAKLGHALNEILRRLTPFMQAGLRRAQVEAAKEKKLAR